jgi:hypothetical protein
MLTNEEFAPMLAYLAAAVQKPISLGTAKVYLDLLGDLPAKILEQAIRAAVIEHRYATIPPVAVIREIAAKIQGTTPTLTAMESLAGVRRLINDYGGIYATPDDRTAAYARMPRIVASCLKSFGWENFCDSENRETLQAQWRMNWDQIAERERSANVLPEDLRRLVNGRSTLAIPDGMLRMPGIEDRT